MARASMSHFAFSFRLLSNKWENIENKSNKSACRSFSFNGAMVNLLCVFICGQFQIGALYSFYTSEIACFLQFFERLKYFSVDMRIKKNVTENEKKASGKNSRAHSLQINCLIDKLQIYTVHTIHINFPI